MAASIVRGRLWLNLNCRGFALRRTAGLALLLCVAGCGSGFVRDCLLDGPYRLVAVDLPEDMILCRSIGTTGDCVGVGPGATIFQAGYNANYIVLARPPREWPKQANRSISEFYYVIRSSKEAVVGPMDKLEYDREKQRLGLPDFSRVFDDLK